MTNDENERNTGLCPVRPADILSAALPVETGYKPARRTDFKSVFRFCLMLVLVIVIVIGCGGRRITKANVDEVTENMSKKQVESILGSPSEIDNKDFIVMKKTTYVYRQGKDTVTIVFKDDKVQEKQSTFTD
jgi:SmpA / OmlA family